MKKAAGMKEDYERKLDALKATMEERMKRGVDEVKREWQHKLASSFADAEMTSQRADKRVAEVEEEMREMLTEWKEEKRAREGEVEKLSSFIQHMRGRMLK